MTININNPPVQAIPIGRCGENEFRAITIDVSAWLAVRPEGKVSVIYCRPDGELYPVIVNATESPIVWRPTATDTAVAGKGAIEVRITSGDVLGKSCTIRTAVAPALGAAGESPAAPAPDWAQTVAENAASAAAAAEKAEAASTHMPQISASKTWLVWDADAGEYVDSGVSAAGAKGDDGNPGKAPIIGSNGNWYEWDDAAGTYTDTGKPSRGEKGETGASVTIDDTLTQSGQAADAKATGDAISALSEEKVDQSALGLVIGTDGKIYVAINGVATGSGIEITGGTASGDDVVDTTYQVQLSDGITLNTLMFQDEFDGDGLSSTWKPAHGHSNAALTNWWSAGGENIGVADSCLRLTMLRNNPNSTHEISGAKVESMQFGADNNYGFDTGYCEVKFKLDKTGEGIWPAIWCVGQCFTESFSDVTDESVKRTRHGLIWPWSGEIDQMDGMKSVFTPGLIYQTDPYKSSELTMKGGESKALDADTWYMVGVYKSKDQIKVYFDRTLIATFDITGNEYFSGMGENIILNISTGTVGGTLPDGIDEVNMYVDYVRVYSLNNSFSILADQDTSTLLPDYVNGFSCVADRQFLLMPQFAENTKNTALYWESDNTAVAQVEDGYVTTVANGACNITAKDVDGNIVISFALEVKADAGILASAIEVTSGIKAIASEESANVTANIYPVTCDSLTPELIVLSGAEYCSIDGLTIQNINDSGEDQTAIVRVGTNNPEVYKDLEITLKTAANYDVTPIDNLVCNYNVRGITGGTSDIKTVTWKDSAGNGKDLVWVNTSGNLVFDGTCLSSTSSIWFASNVIMTDNVPDEFTAIAMVLVTSGDVKPFVNGDMKNKYNAPSEYPLLRSGGNLSVYQDVSKKNEISVGDVYGQKIIIGETFNADRQVATCLVTADGTLYKVEPVQSLYESAAAIGNIKAFGPQSTNCGFIGNSYQILIFNKTLTDEEIVSYATQMFEKNPD